MAAGRPWQAFLQPWLKEQWIIPPEANAEFVCAMEDALEVYQRPYKAQRPLVCFDEGIKPLVKEGRTPLPAAPGRPERIDYEYERHGTGHNSPFTAHLLQALGISGRDTEVALKAVRAGVQQTTKGEQVPWVASSMTGDFYLAR